MMANRLREIRQQRKLPLVGVTVRSGVATATLSAIERHGYRPSLETKARIAEALGVGVADIWPPEVEVADVRLAAAEEVTA
jgi:DNA-binding XRE family transcriptional regulator